MIRYRSLSVTGSGSPILDSVDLELPERGTAVLLGPSGCGKTTLLRCTIREDEEQPSLAVRGSIELAGQNVRARSYPATTLRRQVGLIAQSPTPFPGSALDNVRFALHHTTRLARAEIQQRALAALAEAGLESAHHATAARHLSGGQLKRLAVARAIALEPLALLMDEPTTGLDPLAVARIENLISDLAATRLVVVVSHDVALARRIGDVVHVLWPFQDGSRVLESGSPSEVLDTPRTREVTSFVQVADHGGSATITLGARAHK